ncbi:hypothetical protein D2E92_23055 [Mycobacteroides abscessus]|uniref:SIR2 family protein n=1 Tax=Mycobacteroides abscessus TaxID=36809 RepID=UPI000E695E05|nr:SIR2 family protein [Mycobacteroides abscessus]MBN7498403.1 SIR2 family protein [Mycobacteroides abscessus subsp. abscessus]RIU22792.1 hypothetical protein D2E92_23055 [Mycobacteroides abscessus]
MTDVRINGVRQQPIAEGAASGIAPDRLRTIIQDSRLNFLIGAGTSSSFFASLGNIEQALTELAALEGSTESKLLVRASIQAYFFENVLVPNRRILARDQSAEGVLLSYARFLRTLNRILTKRHSSLLAKQVNVFTTNVDMVFEVALEQLGIDYSDGFSGKIRPRFDLGDFNTLRFRTGSRYEHRSEVPVFNLVKLHGSAAWRQEARDGDKTDIFFDHGLSLVEDVESNLGAARAHLLDVLVEPQPPEGQGPTIRPVGDLLSYADCAIQADPDLSGVQRFTDAYGGLGIVNPDKRKFATTVMNETYYELIRRFANELERENSVLFVHGFSFRDEHLRDLVLRAARTNPTLQVIVFCFSRKDREAYTRLLPDTEVKNGNILFVAPAGPPEGETERFATLDVVEEQYFAPVVADRLPQPDQRIELDIRTTTSTEDQ